MITDMATKKPAAKKAAGMRSESERQTTETAPEKGRTVDALKRECVRVFFEASSPGGPPRWLPGRFRGRHDEFGLADDYALAVALVDIAIGFRFNMINGHIDPMSAASADRAISDRIEHAKRKPVTRGDAALLTIDELAAKELALDSVNDPVAWDACVRVVSDALVGGLEIPFHLRVWAAQALRGEIRVDRRRNAGARNAPRDDAIRFAVRMALESGALEATHSDDTKNPGPELPGARAKSACQLVALKLSAAGIGVAVSYKQVEKVWGDRNRKLDASTS